MPALALPSLHKTLRDLQAEKHLSHDVLELCAPEIKGIVEGLPKGAITEVFGPPSSGKTTFLHAALAAAVQAGEYCTLIDVTGSFDPVSADASGVDLRRLLWVRCCGRLENALQATDMLVHGGGWGLLVLDLGDVAPAQVRKLPLSYWHRFRLAIQNTPAALLVIEKEPFVRSCASLAIEMKAAKPVWSGSHPTFRVLDAGEVEAAPRKPIAPAGRFRARTLLSA